MAGFTPNERKTKHRKVWMLPTYVHVSAKSSIPPSLPVAKINFWANEDGIIRELYVEGEGYGVSIMALLAKERGREARPAVLLKTFQVVHACYVSTDADDSMEWNGPAPLPF